MLRRALFVVIALCALCALPGPAQAAKRCRAGRASVTFRHRRVCVKVHGDPADDQIAATVNHVRSLDAKARLKPRHRGPKRRVPRWLRSAGLRRTLARAVALAGRNRDAHARIADDLPRPTHKVTPIERDDGWKGTLTQDFIPENGDNDHEAGFGFEEKDVIRVRKGSETDTITKDEKISLDECPDVNGNAAGTHTWRQDIKATDGNFTRTYHEQAKTKIAGHTTADGHLRDYDLDMHYASTYQAVQRDDHGKVVASDPPRVYAIHLSKHGLKLLSFEDFLKGKHDAAFDEILAGGFTVDGAHGPDGSSGFDTAARRFALAEMRASNALKTLESAWLDGECLRVAISSSDVSLSPSQDLLGHDIEGSYAGKMAAGQAGHFTVTARRRQSDGKLAPGTFRVELFRTPSGDTGQASPASGGFSGSPFGLTYTAPTKGWTTKPPTDAEISVSIDSHQGHTLGVVHITPAANRLELVYTHTSTASYSYSYGPNGFDMDRGTYAEQRNVALSSTVPLTLDAAHTTGTGSAGLAWQRTSWLTDNDDTSRSLSGDDCDIDFHDQVTATKPGTLQVKSLVLGPPGAGGRPTVKSLDVVLGGVGEHWHTHETLKSGPCPVFDSDDDQGIFLNQFTNFHDAGGDDVSAVPNPADPSAPGAELRADSGWQAGSGNVLATRTFKRDWFDGGPAGQPAGAVVHWTDTFALVQATG